MSTETNWIYYRVFLTNPNSFDQFITLLNDAITPMVKHYDDSINHFHFFFYRGKYQDHVEDVKERLAGAEPDQPIAFIRFRVQMRSSEIDEAERLLQNLINKCPTIRGVEIPIAPFDERRDLGGRFGDMHYQAVMRLIDAAARLALGYAKHGQLFDPSQGQDGSYGVVHLVANTLGFNLYPHQDQVFDVQVWDIVGSVEKKKGEYLI